MSKISIIVPIKYGKDIAQVCLDSIKQYTSDYQLIVVDDGSDKELKEFLEQTRKDILIRNEVSVGFPKAVNQGIERAIGEYIIILNSDTVVTPNWTKKLITHFEKDNSIGLLSCTTNRVEGFQHIDYNQPEITIQYADVITGILMMLKKSTLDILKQKNGYYLDPRFGLGGQEDSDISFRVRQLGLKVGIARDVFIYHYGSASFREEFNNDVEYSKQYAKSRVQILRDKYKNTPMAQSSVNAQMQNNNMRKKLVFICIPNLGNIRSEFVPLLTQWAKNDKYDIRFWAPILQPLDNARNTAVKKFLEISNDPNDLLVFIDDDIILPIDALDKLIAHDKDVVSPTCFIMKNHDKNSEVLVTVPTALKYNEDKQFIIHWGSGLEEVDGFGGGCLIIKRKVLETMERPFEYEYYPDGTLKLVADFKFCQIAQKNGFKLYYDFDVLCKHIKATDLKNINDYLLLEANKGR